MSTSSLNIPWGDYQTTITSVIIENGVTSIGDFAFRSCSNLSSVSMADSVVRIGKNAFKDCTSLTDINYSNMLTSIDKNAFCNCTSLKSIIFPNTLTTIGESAFEDCTSLVSVVIPDCVHDIGDYAFDNCSNELVIHCSFASSAMSYAKADGISYDDSYIFEQPPTPDPEDANAYLIYTANDLTTFQSLCEKNSSYRSKKVSLQADIIVSEDWKSITEYSGTFKGNGHTISGLNRSLFTTLTETAVVKDLTLSDVDIAVTTGGNPVGGMSCTNKGKIENCSVSGKVGCEAAYPVTSNITWMSKAVFPATFQYFCVGGIAGLNSGEITDCINTATVRANNTSTKEDDDGIYYAASGGIAGQNSGSILQCTSTGSVSAGVDTYSVPPIGETYATFRHGYTAAVSGGICGLSKGSVKRCRSTGASASNYNLYGVIDVFDLCLMKRELLSK